MYRQLSRQDDLNIDDPQSPSRQLHELLFGGIANGEGTGQHPVDCADRGCRRFLCRPQDGEGFLGSALPFPDAVVGVNGSGGVESDGSSVVGAGASEFEGLAALPLVPQELDQISVPTRKDSYLNKEFTPTRLIDLAGDPEYNQLHVATHAEFKPGGPAASQLHSGVGPMTMEQLTALRQTRKGFPLDLVVFSACRTALGDADAELGFSGLALQAGQNAVERSGMSDVVSAYFVQMVAIWIRAFRKPKRCR